ncbi:hypothetical protein [Sphingomonas beigongshangi]|uniref:hypothetical protein n=1 Tax=Sphingomonas beigongshangi TaxID=2782540 RepID=UPI00193BDB03|nr:hypothetical protein [Sphingomonas beigongshangi]
MQSKQYEHSDARVATPDRPRLPSQTLSQRTTQNRRVIFRCPDQLVQSAQDAADRSKMGFSEYLRDLIRRDVRGL